MSSEKLESVPGYCILFLSCILNAKTLIGAYFGLCWKTGVNIKERGRVRHPSSLNINSGALWPPIANGKLVQGIAKRITNLFS